MPLIALMNGKIASFVKAISKNSLDNTLEHLGNISHTKAGTSCVVTLIILLVEERRMIITRFPIFSLRSI